MRARLCEEREQALAEGLALIHSPVATAERAARARAQRMKNEAARGTAADAEISMGSFLLPVRDFGKLMNTLQQALSTRSTAEGGPLQGIAQSLVFQMFASWPASRGRGGAFADRQPLRQPGGGRRRRSHIPCGSMVVVFAFSLRLGLDPSGQGSGLVPHCRRPVRRDALQSPHTRGSARRLLSINSVCPYASARQDGPYSVD